MPALPRNGSLDQILRALALMAQSAAYQAALNQKIAAMNPGPLLNLIGVDGSAFALDLSDTQAGGPAGWLGRTTGTTAPGFAAVYVTDHLRLAPPYPVLELAGMPGHGGVPGGTRYEEAEFRSWSYVVDAVAITQEDDPQAAQRSALVMVDALEQLVERNDSLGGLVELISATSPPHPGGSHPTSDGIVAAALVRFEVSSLRTSGR